MENKSSLFWRVDTRTYLTVDKASVDKTTCSNRTTTALYLYSFWHETRKTTTTTAENSNERIETGQNENNDNDNTVKISSPVVWTAEEKSVGNRPALWDVSLPLCRRVRLWHREPFYFFFFFFAVYLTLLSRRSGHTTRARGLYVNGCRYVRAGSYRFIIKYIIGRWSTGGGGIRGAPRKRRTGYCCSLGEPDDGKHRLKRRRVRN